MFDKTIQLESLYYIDGFWKPNIRKKKKPKGPNNSFYLEVKPALLVLGIFGRFPYWCGKTGPEPFSLFSFPVLYTVFFNAVCWWVTALANYHIVQGVEFGRPLDELVFSGLAIIYSVLNFLVPITYIWDAPKMVAYINQWKEFEAIGGRRHINMKCVRITHLGTYFTVVYSLTVSILQTIFFYDVSPLGYLQYFPCLTSSILVQLLWNTVLYELRVISRSIMKQIEEAQTKPELTYNRQLKLKLDLLMSELGNAMGNTLLSMNMVTYACFLLCVYGSLQVAIRRSGMTGMVWALIIFTFNYLVSHFVHCETAHRTTIIMRDEFSRKLLELDVNARPTGWLTEIYLLFKAMAMCPPVVGYNGYTLVNRQFFTNFLSSTLTYLIVLIQFSEIGDGKEQSNSTKLFVEDII